MKKIALLVLFLGMMAQSGIAQFRFGINAAPHWTWISTDDKKIEGAASNLGFRFGLSGDFFLDSEERYAITSGMNLSFNQGGTIQNGYNMGVFWPNSDLSEPRFDTLPMDAQLTYHVNYLEIPVGFKMRGKLSQTLPLKFYFELPVFNIGFRLKGTGDIENTFEQNTEDETIKEDISPIAFTWGLGTGVEYELSSGATITGGISFQSMINDFTKDDGRVFDGTEWKREDSRGRVNMFALRVGLFF